MSTMLEDVQYLSKNIGPRPAGTEEERLAAMFIGETIQKKSGFGFEIEDFEGAKGNDRAINALPVISSILLFFGSLLQLLNIPVLIITIGLAVLSVLEYKGKSIVSKFFRFGISQNVVAKFVPTYSSSNPTSQRKRKVVLVSHYDTDKCFPGNSSLYYKFFNIFKLLSFAVMVLVPIFMLVKIIAFPDQSGSFNISFLLFSLLFLIISFLPISLKFYKSRLLYTEGANCNASANAVLIEIAKRLGVGSFGGDISNKSTDQSPVIHGKEAAQQSGVIGGEVNLEYNAQPDAANESNDDLLNDSQENKFLSAKAALEAFAAPKKRIQKFDKDGNPIDSGVKQEQDLQNSKFDKSNLEEAHDTSNNQETIKSQPIVGISSSSDNINSDLNSSMSVPDWFKKAQNKAHINEDENSDNANAQSNTTTVRSKYAQADDLMKKKKEEALKKKQLEEEEKRKKLREQILAAQKAAEEERKKHFGDDKPFFRQEDDSDKTNMINSVDSKKSDTAQENDDNLPLDERLKIRQMKDKNKSAAQKAVQENDNNKKIDSIPEVVTSDNKSQLPEEPEATIGFAPVNDTQEKPDNVNEVKQDDKENIKTENSEDANAGSDTNSKDEDLQSTTQIDLDKIKQYAPLDDQAFISSNDMPENDSLNEIPEVFIEKDSSTTEQAEQNNAENKSENIAEEDQSEDKIEKGTFGTGSFAAISSNEGIAGATGTFSPVKEELIEDASKSGKIGKKEDMIIDDADDDVYNKGQFTDTGAFAGKGYVDMPEKNKKGLFGLFGKNKVQADGEEDLGKHSHKNKKKAKRSKHSADILIDDSAWEGGAFAGLSEKIASTLKPGSKSNIDTEEQFVDQQADVEQFEDDGNFAVTDLDAKVSPMIDAVPDFEGQIQEFHNESLNIEVWMIALGSELDDNAGMRNFIMEHSQELNGAIIIDIEALGKGQLCFVDSEGLFSKSKTSPRLKRYVRQAANKLGISVPTINMPWNNSSAYYANKRGLKTIRFCGVEDGLIANNMSAEDTVDTIDKKLLEQNTRYLLELIKSI